MSNVAAIHPLLAKLERTVGVLEAEMGFEAVEQFCLVTREVWTVIWKEAPADATPDQLPADFRGLLDEFLALIERGIDSAHLVLPRTADQATLLADYDRNCRLRWEFGRILKEQGALAVDRAMRQLVEQLRTTPTPRE